MIKSAFSPIELGVEFLFFVVLGDKREKYIFDEKIWEEKICKYAYDSTTSGRRYSTL